MLSQRPATGTIFNDILLYMTKLHCKLGVHVGGTRTLDSCGYFTALDAGRTSAVAGQLQRDMQARAAACGDLFAAKSFDAALFGTLSMAIAFGSPWLSSDRLRITCRTTIWAFGLDWRVDRLGTSREDVREVARQCLAVADGVQPTGDDGLTGFLADIRDELAAVESFRTLGPVWRDELARLVRAQAREWNWRSRSTKPSLDQYLANADNAGFSFVYTSHLIYTSDSAPIDDLAELRSVGRKVQRAIRLLNDLATYDRDVAWGDLNALMLPGVNRTTVERRIAALTTGCRRRIDALRDRHPEVAQYLERQLGFCVGFYDVADFWGPP
jgi:hypothetical protein